MEVATPRTRAALALTRQEQQLVKHGSGQPVRSLNRQLILTEEEYSDALERIIARDFFPMLSGVLKRRDEEAMIMKGFTSNDPDVIERSVKRLENWMDATPAWSVRYNKDSVSNTPRTTYMQDTPRQGAIGKDLETPVSNRDLARKAQKDLPYDSNLTLDEFQAKYTSEDNASFAEIINEENVARRSKYAWAYKAEQTSNDKARRAIEAREKLVDLARRLAEGDSEVRLIEGAEAGRPGERILIEGRESLPGDRASIEFAKRRIAAAPSKERLLIEAGGREQDTQQSLQDREKELQVALAEGGDEVDKLRKEGKDAGLIQTWPTTVGLAKLLPSSNMLAQQVFSFRLATIFSLPQTRIFRYTK